MAAQGWMLHRAARCREQPLGAAVSQHQDLSLGRRSAPHATHTLGFTPGLPPPPSPIKMKGALQPLSIFPGTPGTVLQCLVFLCCQSQGCLKDDSTVYRAVLHPSTPREGSILLFSYLSAWFQLSYPFQRLCQGGETGTEQQQDASRGWRVEHIFHHSVSVLRLLQHLSWYTGQHIIPDRDLSCER